MTDHAQRALAYADFFLKTEDAEWALNEIPLLLDGLRMKYHQARAQGRREGLEEAARICEAEALVDDERGYYGNEMAKGDTGESQ